MFTQSCTHRHLGRCGQYRRSGRRDPLGSNTLAALTSRPRASASPWQRIWLPQKERRRLHQPFMRTRSMPLVPYANPATGATMGPPGGLLSVGVDSHARHIYAVGSPSFQFSAPAAGTPVIINTVSITPYTGLGYTSGSNWATPAPTGTGTVAGTILVRLALLSCTLLDTGSHAADCLVVCRSTLATGAPPSRSSLRPSWRATSTSWPPCS